MERGQAVRFTAEHLGLMNDPIAGRFIEDTVTRGDEGFYYGPSDIPERDWHWVQVQRGMVILWCPVHSSHFEPVTP